MANYQEQSGKPTNTQLSNLKSTEKKIKMEKNTDRNKSGPCKRRFFLGGESI